MMVMSLRLILFVRVTIDVEICLVTEKSEVQEIRMSFDTMTGGLPKGRSLSLICISLKIKNMHLIQKKLISWCIMHITEVFEKSVSWDKSLVDFRDSSKHCLTVIM